MKSAPKNNDTDTIATSSSPSTSSSMENTYVCREDVPGGSMAGFCPSGSVIVSRSPAQVAMFKSSAEAREFILAHLPGGMRNWAIERI